MLTFIGNLLTKSPPPIQNVNNLTKAMVWFGLALGFSSLTPVSGYVSALAQGFGMKKDGPIFRDADQ
jgi:hypothetical protein